MRSRDGLQKVCVVCEDKPKKLPEQVISLPKDDHSSSDTDDIEMAICFLKNLNYYLKTEGTAQHVQSFLSILEAALPAVKECLKGVDWKCCKTIFEEIRDKIKTRILDVLSNSQISCTDIIVNHFQILSRLFKCLNELPEIR